MHLIGKDVKVSNYRKNVEKEFYKSFETFLRLSQIFCAAPIKLDFLSESSILKTFDKVLSITHLMYGFFICSCVCTATYLQHKHFDLEMGFLSRVLYMGEYIIGTVNLLLVILACQYQRRFYVTFFRRLVNVDINLQKCGVQPNYATTKRYLKRSLIAYASFFVCVIFIDFFYNEMRADSFVRSSTVYTIPNVVSTLALTQYSAVLHYIRDKLKTINAILMQLIMNNSFKEHQQMINNKLNIISVLSMNSGQSGTDRILNNMRKQHAELSRLTEKLNNCFGILIVLTLLAAYIILSTQFYAFYKMSEGFEETEVWLSLYTVLWVILHSGKVLLILYPIHDVTDERKRTGILIYGIDLTENNVSDMKIAKSLKTFSRQLLHETSPPNALRLINLDLTVVSSMYVGVLTTYLIILIQFDASARGQTNIINNITHNE